MAQGKYQMMFRFNFLAAMFKKIDYPSLSTNNLKIPRYLNRQRGKQKGGFMQVKNEKIFIITILFQ
jgi:hypothetical protein